MASATRNKTNLSVRPTGILVLTWSGLCRMQVGSNPVESNTNGVPDTTWYLVPLYGLVGRTQVVCVSICQHSRT